MASSDRMKVIVVGAGLGGCAAALAMRHHGHDVVVYEKIRTFRRLGDSLGLGENALKLLQRWGAGGSPPLYDRLIRIGNQAETMQIRRWHDGKVLAEQPLMDMAGRIGHRGDYHEAFLAGVRDAGIPLYMGREVVEYVEPEPEPEPAPAAAEPDDAASATETKQRPRARPRPRVKVVFADGITDEADLVVGADGIKSRARTLVLGFADAPRSSGYACFRAYGTSDHVRDIPQSRAFVEHDCVNIWIGIDTHMIQNTLRDGAEFNWIVTRKLTDRAREQAMLTGESWFRAGDMDEVRQCIATVDPRIRAAVAASTECLDWLICSRDPLPTWVAARSHQIALLGDSCHPHLPTSAQGASQATESAGVLAVCLSLARGDVPLATRTYEKLRFARVRQSQTNGEDLRDRWHNALRDLDDGAAIDPESIKIRNRWLYAFDAEADTRARWPAVSAQVAEELRTGRITPLCDVQPAKANGV
ncbi:Aromatic-ring hydroxylase-like protein [Niveomyces insectorum RCEF 264]|uniref:Aromatic-ring hydroxylase-like protein n=1 Tax=Niveomyces insectorum RCEF 264 TaxID=1081102 RepID=A0A167SFG1_9HYPO|nr:Aromatic-ring hydroxylase-like protein [Niveomyces insectorum RCEF 264]